MGSEVSDLLKRHRSLRVLVGLVILSLAIHLLGVIWGVLAAFGDIIVIFFLAWVIAFLLEPVTAFLMAKRIRGREMPRMVATSLVYLALLVVVSGMIALAVPAIQSQAAHMFAEIQRELSGPRLAKLSDGVLRTLERLGFSPQDAQDIVGQTVTQLPAKTHSATTQAIASASTLVPTIATALFDTSLVFIISFYMMLDGGKLMDQLNDRLPPSWREDFRTFQRQVNDTFGGFFRTQFIVAGIYAVLTGVVMLLIGAPSSAFLAAFLAGVLMLLPFIGAFLSVVPPVLLFALQTPLDAIFPRLLVLLVLLYIAQYFCLNGIAPRMYSRHLGISPILIFAALLLGAKEGGVWGAFFSVPLAGIIYAIGATIYQRISSIHPLFQAPPATGEPLVAPLNGHVDGHVAGHVAGRVDGASGNGVHAVAGEAATKGSAPPEAAAEAPSDAPPLQP